MKTAELTGAALDWAVARCEGMTIWEKTPAAIWKDYAPSTDWAQGGPIIEREIITLIHPRWDGWTAHKYDEHDEEESYTLDGPTPLIAAMRCYVASKLGDEVEIPQELTT